MRNRWCALSLVWWLVFGFSLPVFGKPIEAIQGKRYPLSEKHGPWMVMVTSLEDKPGDAKNAARDAADQMVYQLRRNGIPAYVYETEERRDHFASLDPLGQEQRRVSRAQTGMIAVLAGNYPKSDTPLAQATLAKLRSPELKLPINVFSPEKQVMQRIDFHFPKAFLSKNPLLKDAEKTSKIRDPLLLQLNSGVDGSLLSNKGKYSLVVASMYGTSNVKSQGMNRSNKSGNSLDIAGLEAWQLSKLLNNNPRMKELGLQAYVYHDRHCSLVTVGSFNSKDDPGIRRATEAFKAKYVRKPNTQQDVLVAQFINMPAKPGEVPAKSWAFDPVPKLMEVPTR